MSSIKLKGSSSGEAIITTASDASSVILDKKLDLNGQELILDVDADTSIHASTDDQIDIKVGGTDLAKLTDGQLSLTSATASRPGIVLESTNADANPPFFRFQKNSSSPANNDEIGQIQWYSDDSGGNVFIPATIKVVADSVADGSEFGQIRFLTSTGGTHAERGRFQASDFLVGSTGTDLTERVHFANTDGGVVCVMRTVNSGGTVQIGFKNANGFVGEIVTTGSGTAYVTSSDYRLKENVSYTFDATSRLKQLKPARFNFKADADTTLDGFLAHEVSSIVPEAVVGTKDETETYKDDNGDDQTRNKYQGIDQAKLVPLLVKTIQEQQAVIEDLQSRVTTLEG
tara:strand:+ start:978 stop:2009 length:1032 start_codon:yes stop_codon:yes gene_type:complete